MHLGDSVDCLLSQLVFMDQRIVTSKILSVEFGMSTPNAHKAIQEFHNRRRSETNAIVRCTTRKSDINGYLCTMCKFSDELDCDAMAEYCIYAISSREINLTTSKVTLVETQCLLDFLTRKVITADESQSKKTTPNNKPAPIPLDKDKCVATGIEVRDVDSSSHENGEAEHCLSIGAIMARFASQIDLLYTPIEVPAPNTTTDGQKTESKQDRLNPGSSRAKKPLGSKQKSRIDSTDNVVNKNESQSSKSVVEFNASTSTPKTKQLSCQDYADIFSADDDGDLPKSTVELNITGQDDTITANEALGGRNNPLRCNKRASQANCGILKSESSKVDSHRITTPDSEEIAFQLGQESARLDSPPPLIKRRRLVTQKTVNAEGFEVIEKKWEEDEDVHMCECENKPPSLPSERRNASAQLDDSKANIGRRPTKQTSLMDFFKKK